MKIERLKKSMILFFLISISIFANCKENNNNMKFSFEKIQNLYSISITFYDVFSLET